MVSFRWLTSPASQVAFNLVAIIFLTFNLIQNHFLLHNHAVKQSGQAEVSDLPTSGLRASSGNGADQGYRGPISLTIPRGKAVARPAARLSEEEDSKIKRAHYGGKGDKPHLGAYFLYGLNLDTNQLQLVFLTCTISYATLLYRWLHGI
jgi:hypothetical protein